jgi:hypothetical protein
MALSASNPAELPLSVPRAYPAAEAPTRGISVSALMSFFAGALTTFTVSVVGEMPVGEIVLMLVAGWALLCVIFNRTWPGPLLRSRLLWTMLAAQLVGLVAYVASDLYRHSAPHDMARGWARMIFLAIDILAVAYLFGRSRRNFVIFLVGQCLGDLASVALFGPMFGDMWKFGIGAPLTMLVFLTVPLTGPVAAVLAAFGMGYLHFRFDYRSFGGVCAVAGVLLFLKLLPPRSRLWLAPLIFAVAAAGVFAVYQRTQDGRERATRSDIERSAMVEAAVEAVEESPFIGHGSWFSNSNVYENFMIIRHIAAKQARVGGFADPNRETDTMALHSQLLVALAEGGLFGGAFFILFGVALLQGLGRITFVSAWHRLTPVAVLVLLSAFWNLLFSPFSGAHRVYIAVACGLLLLLPELNADARPPFPAQR